MSDHREDKKLSIPKFSSFSSRQPDSENVNQASKPDSGTRTVPKFGSFKDKDSKGTQDRANRDSPDRHKHRSRSHRDHRSRHRDHQSRKRTSRSRSPRPSSSSKRDIAGSHHGSSNEPTPSSAFYFDLKGDPLISKYGGINKSEIPAYYRAGRGQILGTPGRLLIHRDGARDQFSVVMPGEGSFASKDRGGLRSRVAWAKQSSISVRPQRLPVDDANDFIAVGRAKKRKHSKQSAVASSDDEQLNYRSIEGKAKSRSVFENETDESSGAEDLVEVPPSNPARSKAIELEKRVKDHPNDTDAWMELVDHQDVLSRAGEAPGEHATENAARSFTEIKVSMLESALKQTSIAADRSRILTRLMSEGIKIWPVKKATQKWTELTAEEDHNFALWRIHLDFSMSNAGVFRHSLVANMLASRLSRCIQKGSAESISEAIYIFARAMHFFRDAGYKELAVAGWQAVVELNLFSGTIDEYSRLPIFTEFWDSEVPRLGDKDARGWYQYAVSDDHIGIARPAPANSGTVISSGDSHKAWGMMETKKAEQAQLPAGTMDEGNGDDPYRVIVYSDIGQWLFVIPEQHVAQVKHQLIDAFLLFCGLPPLGRDDSWVRSLYADQFMAKTPIKTRSRPSQEQYSDEGAQDRMIFSERSGIQAALSADLFFDAKNWFTIISEGALRLPIEWVRNAVKQLVYDAKCNTLAMHHLALEFVTEPANIRKSAKSLLKHFPGDIGLYQAYAVAEYVNGNTGMAEKVLETATSMLATGDAAETLRLWNTWAYLNLASGDKEHATSKLCAASIEGSDAGPYREASQSAVLKACRVFRDRFYDQITTGCLMHAATYGESLVLLDYLTADDYSEPASAKQGNISAAMAQVDGLIKTMTSRGVTTSDYLELLLQFAAKLLYLHATRGPFRRVFLQEQFSKFLGIFPQNTILLALYEWADSSLRVVDDTRTMLDEKVLIPSLDCVSSRVFAIQHELVHGSVHSTSNAFEHALRSDSCNCCPGLWIWYIRYCVSEKELRNKARDVYLRALDRCAWSKEVMMEGFITLSEHMEPDELRSVYEAMSSRFMRIHVELESVLEG